MKFDTVKFGVLFDFLPKSKLQASKGQDFGPYKFFTSSSVQKKWIDVPVFNTEALVFGTGGSASVHYVNDKFSTSTDCLVAKLVDAKSIHAKYVWHYLIANIQILEFGFKGAGLKHISKKYIEEIPIKLPNYDEQQRIATILDKAAEIKTKREQAIAKLDELKQCAFVEMFGQPILNQKKYRKYKVDELCKLVRGSSPRPQGDPRYFGGNVPRLMVADITRDGWSVYPRIDSLTEEGAKKSRPIKAGTVVMAVSGNPGLVSKLEVDACIHDGFVGFTVLDEKICRPTYLLALLHMSKAMHEKNKAGAIFVNLRTDDIKAMELPMPSLDEQISYEKLLAKIESHKIKLQKSCDLIESLGKSIQHQVFTTGLNA